MTPEKAKQNLTEVFGELRYKDDGTTLIVDNAAISYNSSKREPGLARVWNDKRFHRGLMLSMNVAELTAEFTGRAQLELRMHRTLIQAVKFREHADPREGVYTGFDKDSVRVRVAQDLDGDEVLMKDPFSPLKW